MKGRTHHYETLCVWEGNRGRGTADYRAYDRDHVTTAPGRPPIEGSSDPVFRGSAERWNPDLLLVASLSQCHMLGYLHQCAVNDVVVTAYRDEAWGRMVVTPDGGGRFEEVLLRPQVEVQAPASIDRAEALHEVAARLCFVAASVNFPVRHEPRVTVAMP